MVIHKILHYYIKRTFTKKKHIEKICTITKKRNQMKVKKSKPRSVYCDESRRGNTTPTIVSSSRMQDFSFCCLDTRLPDFGDGTHPKLFFISVLVLDYAYYFIFLFLTSYNY